MSIKHSVIRVIVLLDLAACVFYSLLYGKAPSGNAFTADLELADALFLQEVAASMVARQPARKEHGS